MSLVPRLALVFALLLAPGACRADTWSGIGGNWFSSTSWSIGDSGPPSSAENAFFPNSESGIPLAVTDVQLSASTTIRALSVNTPSTKQYTFTGANGAVLTATEQMDFGNEDRQSLNVHTIASLRLNTPDVDVFHNAILSLNNSTVTTNSIRTVNDGRIDVNDGSSVQTLSYGFAEAAGELRVNSGGELRIAGDTTLLRGTTTINFGGQLNALAGVDLEYSGTALLQLFSGHSVDDAVHLKATGGGDVTSTSFIDVGINRTGSLTVTGAGSTLSAGSSISDWGQSSGASATVTIADSSVATVSSLRAGTSNAQFIANVTGGATLRTTSSFTMGGGAAARTVTLDVNGGTLETNGLATLDNRADLNLVSGTVDFNGGATFNAGSRLDWTGGALELGANATLLVDAGIVNRTMTSGFIFSDNVTTSIRNGGSFVTPSYFDLGNATLDMTSGGALTVGTTGGTISDWGGNGATTTATLANDAVATFNSGLRMGVLGNGGTTSAAVSNGARLVANGSFIAGGSVASNVTLNVTGGRVESDGTVFLERGATTTVSSTGVIEAQNIVLGSSGGTSSTAVTGADSLLKSRGTLSAGRTGTSTLLISAGGEVESTGSTIIGELAGASATVTVTGGGSRLDVGSVLTVGAGGTGRLNIDAGGFVPVFGGVTVGSAGALALTGSSLETSVGQSIVNNGVVEAFFSSQIRADVTNAGSLNLLDSSITRSVTLQANSVMNVENATVGSLSQQAGADIRFGLLSASDFGKLAVTGAASLAGDVVVTLDGNFTPTLGMTFPIFTAASITGTPTFDFSAAPLPSGLSWAIAIGPTSLELAVASFGLSGDFDLNGNVDGNDFLVWQRGGSPSAYSPEDLALWKSNFGGSLMATLATQSVPEPPAWAMGGWPLLALALRRRI